MSTLNGASDTDMREVRIAQGTIRYREFGTGEPVVLVHGLLVDGQLWRDVAPGLARDFRVIVPEWPLGSHTIPLADGADRTPRGLAQIVADFLAALELERVTLVGNDTGGAISQLVAVEHPERLARLVLTPCDAYDNFLPPAFRPLQMLARVPRAVFMIGQEMRFAAVRRLPLAYGWLSKRADDALTRSWIEPVLHSRGVRRDVAAILRGISSRYTLAAAERFGEFDKPVLLAWAPEDRFFKFEYAERLCDAFPDARLERIDDSLTFVPLDQPAQLVKLIAEFAREPVSDRSVATA
jgi:pimeloyl-ACP methyl ester carboxylesterase